MMMKIDKADNKAGTVWLWDGKNGGRFLKMEHKQ
jgi:hypothetical protein